MSRIRFSVTVGIVSLLMVLGLALPAQAATVCKPLDNPAACTPAFTANQQLAIKSGVPFVWLRNDAKSSAAVTHIVNYSSKARFVIEYSPSVYDGYQNWWLVHLVSDKSKAGWVEQASLVVADTVPDTIGKANWTTPVAAGIKAGVPFVWMRSGPNSGAGVVFTLHPGDTFTILGQPQPTNDGVQWWWYVTAKTSAGPKQGYVEQGSMVPAGSSPATSVPPTMPPNAPPHAVWKEGLFSAIKPGVPYISVRTAPDSAARVLYNLIPGDPFAILTNEQPAYDGYQWWWQVTAPTSNYPRSGWVEEASLVQSANDPTTATTDPNVAQPTCNTMTVRPATFKQGENPSAGGIYYVTAGDTITFDVEGLANLASITFNVPGPNDTLWRTSTSPRKLDFPGMKAEVQAVVPQQYGWVNVSAEAVGLNGATIQCGAFFVDNSTGANTTPATSGDPNLPAVTPDPSS